MPFSFSFTLTVPGLTNPFSSPPEPKLAPPAPRLARLDAGSDIQGYHATAPIRRAPSPSLQPPLSRKRGWVPSAPEYSSPAANPTSTSGYLDTPAKYREMASAYNEGDEAEEMVAGECLIRPLCERTIPAGIHAESDMRAREVLDVGMRPARVRVQVLMRDALLPCLRSMMSCMHTRLSLDKMLAVVFVPSPMSNTLTFHVSIDLPPPKRRRTLAGSIVSTALSAALIGTAVGLTVYRL